MNMISVAEAARELKMEEPEFLKKLREMGVYAEDSFSTFKRTDFDRIKTIIRTEGIGQSVEIEETKIKPGVIRRRAKRPRKSQAVAVDLSDTADQEPEIPAAEEPAPAPDAEETAPVEAAAEEQAPEAAPEVETESPEEIPETEVEAPAEERADEEAEIEAEPSGEPVEPAAETEIAETAEAEGEAETSIDDGSTDESESEAVTAKRINLRGKTSEPARILEKADPAVIESLRASRAPAARRTDGPTRGRAAGDAAAPGGLPPRRSKKSRTVVEVVQQDPFGGTGPGGRRRGKKRNIELRELRFDRKERSFRDSRKFGSREPRKQEITQPKAAKRIIKMTDSITIGDLAKRMGIKGGDVIKYLLLNMGQMMTLNQTLDPETAEIVASEFGYGIENVAVIEEDVLNVAVDDAESLIARHPVVTIMGHVDHGKTSLLEAIRKVDDMLSKEAGGITQHIGAYNVKTDKGQVTFLDTPGHEAFTEMRARGAKVTDIVVLVVAADDGVMPQTKEAINHSKAAGVPIIVAINKIDKPEANPERIRQELTEFELVAEEWGGTTQFVEVSAKVGTNVEDLLDSILLQAEILELKANPNKKAEGVVVEAKLERGRGPVATVLVTGGTLRAHDSIVAGPHMGRVRMMNDHRGRPVEEAGPSMAVEVVGLSGVPLAGDPFNAVDEEKTARQVAGMRMDAQKAKDSAKQAKASFEDLHAMIESGDVKELNLIIKADVQGSIEALAEALQKQSTDKVKVNIIHSAVGAITETDVNLASASNAIIIGFNVRPHPAAGQTAEREHVDVKLYSIIYEVIDEMRAAMAGLLAPRRVENTIGRAEVRQTFSVSKVGTIAGCYVQDGVIRRNARARLVRDGAVVTEAKMSSLKRFKDDAREVQAGLECGIGLENYNDVKIGDVIEAYEVEEVAPEL